jgi:hypothetical protein
VPTDFILGQKKFNAVELFLEILKDEKIVEANPTTPM